MTVAEIESYIQRMITLAEKPGDQLNVQQRVTLIAQIVGVCGAPQDVNNVSNSGGWFTPEMRSFIDRK